MQAMVGSQLAVALPSMMGMEGPAVGNMAFCNVNIYRHHFVHGDALTQTFSHQTAAEVVLLEDAPGGAARQ